MTVITIEFKRGDYPTLDESFINELRQSIEISQNKPEKLSMIIKEDFE
ncbi:MAG: hypothetical protein KJI69_03425 [Patescibacteria group bacterium]|nr:hypothetical protein [Patescibacteria group bacterium]